jgi:hypothetical protein
MPEETFPSTPLCEPQISYLRALLSLVAIYRKIQFSVVKLITQWIKGAPRYRCKWSRVASGGPNPITLPDILNARISSTNASRKFNCSCQCCLFVSMGVRVLQPAGLLYRPLWTFQLWPPDAPRAYRRVPHSSGGSWNLRAGIWTDNFA